MIGVQVLHNTRRPVLHIRHANLSAGGLVVNKLADIFQLRAQAYARTVVQQDEQFKGGMICLRGNPIGHLIAIVSFIDHDFIAINHGDFFTMLWLDRDN